MEDKAVVKKAAKTKKSALSRDELTREMHKADLMSLRAKALVSYHVRRFGDYLAEREGYKQYAGIEAIQFYLCQKYHWLPATVRSLSEDDIEFLLAEEMHGWTLPEEARV